jgi:hypothetical protein
VVIRSSRPWPGKVRRRGAEVVVVGAISPHYLRVFCVYTRAGRQRNTK